MRARLGDSCDWCVWALTRIGCVNWFCQTDPPLARHAWFRGAVAVAGAAVRVVAAGVGRVGGCVRASKHVRSMRIDGCWMELRMVRAARNAEGGTGTPRRGQALRMADRTAQAHQCTRTGVHMRSSKNALFLTDLFPPPLTSFVVVPARSVVCVCCRCASAASCLTGGFGGPNVGACANGWSFQRCPTDQQCYNIGGDCTTCLQQPNCYYCPQHHRTDSGSARARKETKRTAPHSTAIPNSTLFDFAPLVFPFSFRPKLGQLPTWCHGSDPRRFHVQQRLLGQPFCVQRRRSGQPFLPCCGNCGQRVLGHHQLVLAAAHDALLLHARMDARDGHQTASGCGRHGQTPAAQDVSERVTLFFFAPFARNRELFSQNSRACVVPLCFCFFSFSLFLVRCAGGLHSRQSPGRTVLRGRRQSGDEDCVAGRGPLGRV